MTNKNLPDVAKETHTEKFAPIDWVGMGSIELPILLKQEDGMYRIPARTDAKVSLDKKPSRGIHMSRLYLITQDVLSKNEMTLGLLGKATDEFLKTHEDLSTQALVQVNFEAPLIRKALKSANQAWRSYPVILSAFNENGAKKYYVEVVVTYSSTCPASAALSRQLIQDNFKQQFGNESVDFDIVHSWLGTTQGIVATPHAQRSFARVKAEVGPDFNYGLLIDVVEEALQTAVQGAVKREDEQEFALRNGQNLMFCEDAARRVKEALDKKREIFDYVAEFSHVESLHPHNAISHISKGLKLRSF
ncbi:GTP cyclohydrolase FolE2 [Bdellovibrio svalbardensis]|uniref:GTP cyclohydrolase FolE2 n=1 Tax=Bdellovibrio svalbardensis TaxID=2972972 RepID=A0ABT6DGZ2_9BACT|nr:GTP cyclohydrolase FolE2 [Bdellovibrio svalbardensis]MDG0816131.1 GTP cyclohydrolase FolE2 [Bdellovibrio svalbardensis]